ncbi:MAG: hypothetical protein A3C84_04625 [Candidatus Ryanbacteria bacterium RIFCSPHIGHO2_02_FULL_48_12]|uniref:Uncharacterized protein n=1 Tax=Candidatus Ryanbacteria bacterium RIFCSPHIGHO2_01_FULL_48_27 TaxID=1802115 RepID=A0A1G2G6I8_9BACT|nr:MAG: hypothetical protein A2756_02175 [Candidatus Ryanbacteria bacterium RIFCSPHIGHO2_01_FULL_48_27]OGZ49864.1 MAG: hypothetical protein A3C84_04625 [Candidatus Ryanbacteria bacterium RIFCSPHIGHO2_02_FULL_48_12]
MQSCSLIDFGSSAKAKTKTLKIEEDGMVVKAVAVLLLDGFVGVITLSVLKIFGKKFYLPETNLCPLIEISAREAFRLQIAERMDSIRTNQRIRSTKYICR